MDNLKICIFLFVLPVSNPAEAFAKGDTLLETNLTSHTAADRHPSFSPDGKQIVFESDRQGKWGIYIMNNDGSELRALVADSFNNRIPSFHPKGNIIAFESDRSGVFRLYFLRLIKGAKPEVLHTNHNKHIRQFAAWSPDGHYLAYCSAKSNNPEELNIYVLNYKLRRTIQITNSSYRSLYPGWSADSKELVFFSRKDTKGTDDELYRVNVSSNKTERLTIDSLNNFCPAWIPHSNWIVYVQSMQEPIRPELFVMNINSAEKRRLTFNGDGDTEPAISPDGKWVAWTAFRNGNFEIVKALLPGGLNEE